MKSALPCTAIKNIFETNDGDTPNTHVVTPISMLTENNSPIHFSQQYFKAATIKKKGVQGVREMSVRVQEWTKQNLWKITFKKFEGIRLRKKNHTPLILKALFHKFYLVHS